MKLRTAILTATLTAGLLAGQPVSAETLQEALAMAYARNAELDSARAALRATDENVPQAQSGWRPKVSASAQAGRSYNETSSLPNPLFGGGGISRYYSSSQSVQVQIVQPLFRGGRTVAGIRRATNTVQAQRMVLKNTEQNVLLSAATSYFDVLRDKSVLDLNSNNEQNLTRQLQASRDRFRVGEITRTDVSLSESRLSRAKADRISASGVLNASRATYQRVIGDFPGKIAAEKFNYQLPKTLDESIEESQRNNPQVVYAEYIERAARDGIDEVNGSRLPEVNLVGTVGRNWYNDAGSNNLSTGLTTRQDSASITAQATWQIYSGGLVSSQVRQSKQLAAQRLLDLENAKRIVRETTIRAWEQLTASRAAIESRRAQVDAANLALEGTRQEALVGSKTILDTLDAEQEALNAQTDLVRVLHDEQVAAFSLLAALGRLTGPDLGLQVTYYDANRNYDRVKNKLFGSDIGE